jgi:replication-associated recombination protein RarA
MTAPAEDPWTTVQTAHGHPADEVISALQKAIRRGELEQAVLLAYEMYCTSPELEEFLWMRLQVISAEDVGTGSFVEPVIVESLYQMHTRFDRGVGDRFLFAVHAVRLLATSTKDRTSDELANWARHHVETDLRIPDHALDMHTRRGQLQGRGELHFLTEAALVRNEIPDRDLTWRTWLLERAAERESP